MKRLASILLAALVALSVSASASAHHGRLMESISAGCRAGWKNYSSTHHAQQAHCGLFTDANGDGVCDNCNSAACAGKGHYFTDADNDGICDNCNSAACAGKGHHFTDADNDGICDNCNTNCAGPNANGQGQGTQNCGQGNGRHGGGHGRHHC